MYFSVIVPIYGVEKYIRECVDSILCQDFCDFELILVDDGSKDNCPAICDVHIEQLITGIAFVKTIETMRVGDIFIPLVDCQPLTATNRRVRWESSAPDVVSVSTAGLITAVAPGEATIYAQTLDGSDLSAAMTITVVASN